MRKPLKDMTQPQLDAYIKSVLEAIPSSKRVAKMYDHFIIQIEAELFFDEIDRRKK